MPGTTRHALDEADKVLILKALDGLAARSVDASEVFKLKRLRERILNPKKGRPFPPSIGNLSAAHYGEGLKNRRAVSKASLKVASQRGEPLTPQEILSKVLAWVGKEPVTRDALMGYFVDLSAGEIAEPLIDKALREGDLFESKPNVFRAVTHPDFGDPPLTEEPGESEVLDQDLGP